MAQSSTREDFEPFKLQIAGHLTVANQGVFLRQKSTGHILKPLFASPRGHAEANFYREQSRLESQDSYKCQHGMFSLIPSFHGIRTLSLNGICGEYLELDDLTSPFDKPCILDVKLGAITWDPDAPKSIIERKVSQYPLGYKLGFRFIGMRAYDCQNSRFNMWDKSIGNDDIFRNLNLFFASKDKSFVLEITAKFLERLKGLMNWFQTQRRYRFYRSSLLLVYEGADSGDNEGTMYDLKMIDFSHVYWSNSKEPDMNCMDGLKNFCDYLHTYRRRLST